MNKKITVLLIIVLIALLLQGCGGQKTPAEPTEPDHIVVHILPYIGYAPLYIAEELGYFDEENLDVEFLEIRSIPEQVASMVLGELDVAAPFMSAGLFPGIASANIRIVAEKGHVPVSGCPASVLVARQGLDLQGPEDLAGLTVSYSEFSIEQLFMEKLLARAGLTLDDINTINTSFTPDEMAGLSEGTIDLSNFAEPWTSRANQSGITETWMEYGEIIPDFQFAFLMFGPSILEDNPDIGFRFMRAYQKGVEQYNLGATEENTPLLAEFTGLDLEVVQNICWPTFRADLSVNADSISEFQDWAFENGMVDELVNVDDLIDTQFVDALK
ncbi:MAG: ABC transporter substrate-binding protein [Chloroflexota bacterium]